MKCVKCGHSKGKRACPALGGDICSACCGTYRLKEISCPAECSWLGGLAVIAGLSEPPAEDVRAAVVDARTSVEPWLRSWPRRQEFFEVATEAIFGDDDPFEGDNDWLVDMMVAGIQHGVADAAGLRVVDHMLRARGRDLSPAHAAVLRSLGKAWFSAFRVERVDIDKGLLLRDAVDERELFVHETIGISQLTPGDTVLAFIATTGGVEMFHGIVVVPREHSEAVIAELRRLVAKGDPTDRVATTPHVWGWTLGTLRDLVKDDDRAEYDDLDEDEEDMDEEDMDEEDMDEEDMDEESEDDEGGEPDWTETFDPEEIETFAEHIEDNPRAWLDEATPLLDGMSPRAAAKDPAMRNRVHTLMDAVEECSTLELSDVDKIVDTLGLFETELVYDPSTSPDPETWLRHHAREREVAVRRSHDGGTAHPKVDDDKHAIEHQVIEAWIARDAHSSRGALARLLAAGLTRHEAIHALGDAFSRMIEQTIATQGDVNEDIPATLAAVQADAWRGTMR